MAPISVHDIKFSAWQFCWPLCSRCGKTLFWSVLCKFFRIVSHFLCRDVFVCFVCVCAVRVCMWEVLEFVLLGNLVSQHGNHSIECKTTTKFPTESCCNLRKLFFAAHLFSIWQSSVVSISLFFSPIEIRSNWTLNEFSWHTLFLFPGQNCSWLAIFFATIKLFWLWREFGKSKSFSVVLGNHIVVKVVLQADRFHTSKWNWTVSFYSLCLLLGDHRLHWHLTNSQICLFGQRL